MSDDVTGGRILVVDDEEPNRQLMRALLEPEGYEVSEAVDGATGLQAIEHEDVDLVLLGRAHARF